MISTSKRGVCVEYKAATLFLESGFEVFINASPDGPADLVVWDGIQTYLIDTKKIAKRVNADGSISYQNNPSQAKRFPGVIYLGYCDGEWIWLSDIPVSLSSAIDF